MAGKTVVIQNNRKSLIGAKSLGILLAPGENDVDVDKWAKYKVTKVGKMYLDGGLIKVRKDLKRATPMVENIRGLELAKALPLIETCKSEKLLKLWAKNDPSRQKVQKAIAARLDQFSVAGPPDNQKTAAEMAADEAEEAAADAVAASAKVGSEHEERAASKG